VLWILIAVYVGLRMSAAPDRGEFLKKNWLFVLAILVSILRLIPFLQTLPWVRALTATFGLQVIWIFASADQGLRSMSRMMGRRGVGYALTFTGSSYWPARPACFISKTERAGSTGFTAIRGRSGGSPCRSPMSARGISP